MTTPAQDAPLVFPSVAFQPVRLFVTSLVLTAAAVGMAASLGHPKVGLFFGVGLLLGLLNALGVQRSVASITADAVTRSDKDAQALADVLRFLSGMLQTNKSTNPTAAQLSALLSSLVLTTNANVLHLSLTVPEAQLEGFLTAAHQHQATALSPHSGKPVVN